MATTSGGGVTGAAPSPDLCTPNASGGVTAAPDLCGTCNLLVGDNSIGCDKCEVWLHATEMCSGLPQKVIDVILEYSGEGINYMCMKCRVIRASTAGQGSGGSPSARADKFMADTLQQLFQQLRGMTTVLSSLSAEVRTLSTERESRNNRCQWCGVCLTGGAGFVSWYQESLAVALRVCPGGGKPQKMVDVVS